MYGKIRPSHYLSLWQRIATGQWSFMAPEDWRAMTNQSCYSLLGFTSEYILINLCKDYADNIQSILCSDETQKLCTERWHHNVKVEGRSRYCSLSSLTS